MSAKIDKSLKIGIRSYVLSHREKALAYTFLSSFGLITIIITIFIIMINLDNYEIIAESVGYMVILLIAGSTFFTYFTTAAVWHILKAVEDIVKK